MHKNSDVCSLFDSSLAYGQEEADGLGRNSGKPKRASPLLAWPSGPKLTDSPPPLHHQAIIIPAESDISAFICPGGSSCMWCLIKMTFPHPYLQHCLSSSWNIWIIEQTGNNLCLLGLLFQKPHVTSLWIDARNTVEPGLSQDIFMLEGKDKLVVLYSCSFSRCWTDTQAIKSFFKTGYRALVVMGKIVNS